MINNGLTPIQDLLLTMLIEEAAEVIKVACKIKRFGYMDYHPDDPDCRPNADLLHDELADFAVMYAFLIDSGDVEPANADTIDAITRKKDFYITECLTNG